MTPERRITRVAAYGLVLERRRILLCRISARLPRDSGSWTLPGGGVEFGEDPVDAMAREVAEETGLVVRSLGVAGIDSFVSADEDRLRHGIRIIYRTELLGGALAHEVDGSTDLCAWWSYEQARALPLVALAGVGLELAFASR